MGFQEEKGEGKKGKEKRGKGKGERRGRNLFWDWILISLILALLFETRNYRDQGSIRFFYLKNWRQVEEQRKDEGKVRQLTFIDMLVEESRQFQRSWIQSILMIGIESLAATLNFSDLVPPKGLVTRWVTVPVRSDDTSPPRLITFKWISSYTKKGGREENEREGEKMKFYWEG